MARVNPTAARTAGSAPEQLLEGLDPEQRRVATTLDGPLAVWAGAGTGKTRSITHRIAYASAVGAYDPRRTLAVTFTTRAAGEMRSRLDHLGVRGVQARTFHSAALRQLQYFWPKVHGVELPALVESRLSLVAAASARNRLGTETALLRDLASEIGWAKVSNVTPGSYPALARAAGRQVAGVDPSLVARVLTSYEEIKAEQAVIDFDDILLCTVALLSEHGQVADEVRGRYRHLVVDEYQDVSPLQQQLLMLWLGDADDLCVVGDPEQCIHSFAGARADLLTGFAERHPGSTVVRLVRNYRSTPQIIDQANATLTGPAARMRGATLLSAQRRSGAPVSLVADGSEEDEAAAVAQWLDQLCRQGHDPAELAVLYRVRSQSVPLEAALSAAGVPYLMRGSERFFDRGEVRQLLRRVVEAAAVDPVALGSQALELMASELGWRPEPPAGAGQTRERWESLNAIVEWSRALGDDASLDQVAIELQRRAALQHAPSARGVTLSTIHAAKGLEWDAVAVIGVNEGLLPFVLATSTEQIAEERRLLYVAMTRARSLLRVSWTTRGQAGRPGRRRSRFLTGATADEAVVLSEGAGTARRRAELATCRVCGRALTTGVDRKLGRHQECAVDWDPELYELLREWRVGQAEQSRLPAFAILTDTTLRALAEQRPGSQAELLKIPGIGRLKLEKFGADLLEVLEQGADS